MPLRIPTKASTRHPAADNSAAIRSTPPLVANATLTSTRSRSECVSSRFNDSTWVRSVRPCRRNTLRGISSRHRVGTWKLLPTVDDYMGERDMNQRRPPAGGSAGDEKLTARWAERTASTKVGCKPDWNRRGRPAPFGATTTYSTSCRGVGWPSRGSGITDNLVEKALKRGIPVVRSLSPRRDNRPGRPSDAAPSFPSSRCGAAARTAPHRQPRTARRIAASARVARRAVLAASSSPRSRTTATPSSRRAPCSARLPAAPFAVPAFAAAPVFALSRPQGRLGSHNQVREGRWSRRDHGVCCADGTHRLGCRRRSVRGGRAPVRPDDEARGGRPRAANSGRRVPWQR